MPEKLNREILLTRREAILRVSAMLGGVALVGQSAMLAGCTPEQAEEKIGDVMFSDADIALLDEIADTILPETSTPGAKAAATGSFIAVMIADSYYPKDQQVFLAGMKTLEDECREMHGTVFMSATPEQRLALLEKLDVEQHEYMASKSDDTPAHYFRMMKELTLLGYFTSEIGATQAQRYAETPGRYDPCIDYAPGDRSWSPHA